MIVTDHAALTYLQTSKTKNAKLARWAARLASYDFTMMHRAGRVHNNADGLSRAHAQPSSDTPKGDVTGVDLEEVTGVEVVEIGDDAASLTAAVEILLRDPDVDGTPAPPLAVYDTSLAPANPAAPDTTPGPRQLLLESAPCATCDGRLPMDSKHSVICDRCNRPFHLRCTRLKAVPATYWYCRECAAHIRGRGICCPTEDLEF